MRHLLRSGLIALFALGFALPVLAQSTVLRGTVSDPDGLPLPGATVLIDGTTVGAATGMEGTYSISTTLTGERTLVVSSIGFTTQRFVIDLTPGATLVRDVEMREDALGLDEVFVTGVVNAASKLESSVSISTIQPRVAQAVVPRTTADLFRAIPGIRSEASAGDGNTNVTVRGVPISAGGSKYLQFQEEGLPILLFGDIAFGTADIFLRADQTVDRIEAIRGGSASTLASNTPAGIINFISKTGQIAGGSLATTTGLDYGFQRVDFEYGAPIGDELSFHVGGFFRTGNGERDTGYLAQQGGQIKANLTKFFDAGYARVYAKHLNDRTPAYMPQPIRVTGSDDDPTFENAGTLGVNDQVPHSVNLLRSFGLGADGQRRSSSVADGLRPLSTSLGIEFAFDLGNGFSVENRGRMALNSGRFVAPFTAAVGNRADILGALEGATTRDLSDATLTRSESGDAFSGDLLQGIVLFDTELENFNNVFNDAKVSYAFEQGDVGGSITAGLFTASQKIEMAWLWNSYIMTVEGDNASLIDVMDDDGTMLTDEGVAGYGALFFGNCCGVAFDANYQVTAPYLGVSVDPIDGLNIDASVRWDMGTVSGSGRSGVVAAIDMNNDGTISDVESRANVIDQTTRNPVDYDYDYVSYSAGANYTLTTRSAVFGRYSNGYSAKADRAIFPTGTYVGAASLGIADPYDRLLQAEIGYKQQFNAGGLFVTGFYASTTEQGGFEATTQEQIDNDYRSFGVEVEGVARYQDLDARASLTYTDAEVTSGANEGNRPRRQPTLMFSILPTYSYNAHQIGLSVVGQTSAYAQDSNELELPGFVLLGGYVQVGLTNQLSLGLSANNLLDSIGITESEEGAIPGNGFIRARSVTGRTLTASLRYGF